MTWISYERELTWTWSGIARGGLLFDGAFEEVLFWMDDDWGVRPLVAELETESGVGLARAVEFDVDSEAYLLFVAWLEFVAGWVLSTL